MDLDLLATLVAVADTGSLTAAGRRLGLTQPAVHQQLARLADQSGAVVYRREGRRVVLTGAGLRLAALGREIARIRDDALAELRGMAGAPPVVAAGRGVWLHLVTGLPRCRPMIADGPTALRALQDGVAALAIAVAEPPPGFLACDLRVVGSSLVVGDGDPLSHRRRVRWSDLRDVRWVLPPRGRPLREVVEAHAGPCAVTVEAEGWDLMMRLVQLGAGATIVNDGVSVVRGTRRLPIVDADEVIYRAIWRPGFDAGPLLAGLGFAGSGR